MLCSGCYLPRAFNYTTVLIHGKEVLGLGRACQVKVARIRTICVQRWRSQSFKSELNSEFHCSFCQKVLFVKLPTDLLVVLAEPGAVCIWEQSKNSTPCFLRHMESLREGTRDPKKDIWWLLVLPGFMIFAWTGRHYRLSIGDSAPGACSWLWQLPKLLDIFKHHLNKCFDIFSLSFVRWNFGGT